MWFYFAFQDSFAEPEFAHLMVFADIKCNYDIGSLTIITDLKRVFKVYIQMWSALAALALTPNRVSLVKLHIFANVSWNPINIKPCFKVYLLHLAVPNTSTALTFYIINIQEEEINQGNLNYGCKWDMGMELSVTVEEKHSTWDSSKSQVVINGIGKQ